MCTCQKKDFLNKVMRLQFSPDSTYLYYIQHASILYLSLPAGRDDEVGGQGRGRQGRGPGVLRHDDGAHEEAPRRQEQRSQVKQDGGKKDISLTAKTENKIRLEGRTEAS